MKKYLAILVIALMPICSFASNPVAVFDISTDGFVFNGACNGEAVATDAGQSLKARVRYLVTDEGEKVHIINRVTGHVEGAGQATGEHYFINPVFSPIDIAPTLGQPSDQVVINGDHGAATFMTRFEVLSPGNPDLGVLIIHGLTHLVRVDDDWEFIKEDFYSECRGPDNS